MGKYTPSPTTTGPRQGCGCLTEPHNRTVTQPTLCLCGSSWAASPIESSSPSCLGSFQGWGAYYLHKAARLLLGCPDPTKLPTRFLFQVCLPCKFHSLILVQPIFKENVLSVSWGLGIPRSESPEVGAGGRSLPGVSAPALQVPGAEPVGGLSLPSWAGC